MNEYCKQRLCGLYAENPQHIEQIGALIAPHCDTIAETFYSYMLQNAEARRYLSNELVSSRLRDSMGRWIASVFRPLDEAQVIAFIGWQQEVGHIHARINIPVRLIGMGIRLIKQEVSHLIIERVKESAQLGRYLMLVNQVLDILGELLNDSYLNDVMDYERNAQSLRMDVVSNNLAIECERLRSNLFDWHRQVVHQIYSPLPEKPSHLPDIHHAPFGLWVVHKAELLFPADPVVEQLSRHLDEMDGVLKQIERSRAEGRQGDTASLLGLLDKQVTKASWLLSSLVEQMLAIDNSRDPLTRMLNRRYLPVIMQRETEISIKHGISYAVVFADVDHFKRINDSHGHEAGDRVLQRFAEILNNEVRAGDFIFRYGGEEFLLLFSDTSQEEARKVSERIRQLVSDTRFALDNGESLCITTSIGIAMHQGHPDYNHVIRRADEALYQAKEGGRNRVVLAA